jgi:hypothetical protein
VPLLHVQGHGHSEAEATLKAQLAAVKQLRKVLELALEDPARGEVPPWSPIARHLVRLGFDALCAVLANTGRAPLVLHDLFTVSTTDKDTN